MSYLVKGWSVLGSVVRAEHDGVFCVQPHALSANPLSLSVPSHKEGIFKYAADNTSFHFFREGESRGLWDPGE